MSDGCGRLALRAIERSLRVRAVLVGLELPFVCAVVVAVGSTVMILIKLCEDLRQ